MFDKKKTRQSMMSYRLKPFSIANVEDLLYTTKYFQSLLVFLLSWISGGCKELYDNIWFVTERCHYW